MWLVLPLAVVATACAWKRQQAPGTVLVLAAGTAAGLLPGALREGAGLRRYEVWLPIVIGTAFVICLAPAYNRLSRRRGTEQVGSRPGDLTTR